MSLMSLISVSFVCVFLSSLFSNGLSHSTYHLVRTGGILLFILDLLLSLNLCWCGNFYFISFSSCGLYIVFLFAFISQIFIIIVISPFLLITPFFCSHASFLFFLVVDNLLFLKISPFFILNLINEISLINKTTIFYFINSKSILSFYHYLFLSPLPLSFPSCLPSCLPPMSQFTQFKMYQILSLYLTDCTVSRNFVPREKKS